MGRDLLLQRPVLYGQRFFMADSLWPRLVMALVRYSLTRRSEVSFFGEGTGRPQAGLRTLKEMGR